MTEQFVFAVTEASQVAEVRRQVVGPASHLGFSETDLGKVAIIVTEVATNLVKHAVHGEVVVRWLEDRGKRGVEILAVDKGPGMANLSDSIRDGYSTAGSPGTGMGAMSRLAGRFDLHSAPDKGTVLMTQLWSGGSPDGASSESLDVGVICRAKPGETICGDGWDTINLPGRKLLLVVDGLGHGPQAATAAQEAIRTVRAHARQRPARIVELAHAALRPTRGAVLGVAEMDLSQNLIHYAGVGNIAGAITSTAGIRHLVSVNGTVGHDIRKIQEFSYPFPRNALLVLHSDGLTSHWNLDHYPGLLMKSPGLIAGVLYRDYQRGTDDVTVLAARVAA